MATYKIVFEGAYGIESFGDDAPMIVLAQLLRERLKDVELVVVSRHPQEDHYARWGIRSIAGLEYASKAESLGKWFRGLNPQDEREDLNNLYQEIRTADALVLGAGNFLVDYTIDILKGPIPRFFVLSLMAQMVRTPIMWFGMSVGPIKTALGKDMARLAAEMAAVITVRDEKSIAELAAMDAQVSVTKLPDAGLGLVPASMVAAPRSQAWHQAMSAGRPVIAIAARELPACDQLSSADYKLLMAQVSDALIAQGYSILFIPQCTYRHGNSSEDDRHCAADIVRQMQPSPWVFSIMEDIDLLRCVAAYEGVSAAICTRLHGSVFGAIQGVPTVGINYNPKVQEFYNELQRADCCVCLDQISVDSVLQTLLTALVRHRADPDALSAQVASLRSQVAGYADVLLPLLTQAPSRRGVSV